jgi:apolipoprotein N-acyltransferase
LATLLPQFLRAITPGVLLALAWLTPSTVLSAVAGWLSALGFARLNRYGRLRDFYLAGVVSHAVAFYWLFYTVRDFGRFSSVFAAIIFLLFVFSHAVQFPFIAVLARNFPQKMKIIGFALPAAVFTTELLFPRIFPWAFGHTQLDFTSFAQIAELGGVPILGFLMFWLAATCEQAFTQRVITKSLLMAVTVLVFVLFYGSSRIDALREASSPTQAVAVAQANISTEDKHDVRMVITNENRYAELTEPYKNKNILVVWPESVIQRWIATTIGDASRDPLLKRFRGTTPLLVGGLTYASRLARYNSAIAVMADGTVPEPYHKQVLMPFGEYIPFTSVFPFLREMAAHIGGFTPGKDVKIFTYPSLTQEGIPGGLSVSPLICYEDMIPYLTRKAVKSGAHVLINLTNDAWFGNTVALHQHHLIAAFRAIETRRPLVRSTNTGFTSAISPLGEVMDSLPPYTEGSLEVEVPLLSEQSVWVKYPIEESMKYGAWLLLLLAALYLLVFRGQRKVQGQEYSDAITSTNRAR